MAKNKFSVDFDGFLDLAKQIDEIGTHYLMKATENAIVKSKEYAQEQVHQALLTSRYNFKGTNRSHGITMKSAEAVADMPVETTETSVTAYVGVSWYDAPQATLLAFGTPHIQGDTNLLNALKVKGKVRKEVSRIQQEEFLKVLREAQSNG